MSIAENLAEVNETVRATALSAGRNPAEVRLVAVSKTWPADRIAEAAAAGQIIFGENKVQEILEKVPALPDHLEWHLIGTLQKNKVRKVLPLCAMIHSIDSLSLAERVNRIAEDLELRPRLLLQVNIAGDEAKSGFSPEKIREEFETILALPRIEVAGLMTVPAFADDLEEVRPFFAQLRSLRDELVEKHDCALPELSMGMSHDYRIAIEEGATLVRVGSSIFGQRDYSQG
jgi:pyridoxal phosphate enzyme (YggS family)